MPSFRRFQSALCSIFLVALAHAGTEKVIHNFNPTPQGYYPLGTVVADQLGNLYGTARYGGTYDAGVLYKFSQNSHGQWTQTVLYNFLGGTGAYAPDQVVFDSAGNLYGFSYVGGTAGFGTAVKLSPNAQGVWSATVLYNFPSTGVETALASLIVVDSSGNLYGILGGANRESIFQLTASSNGTWTKTVVHDFVSPSDGDYIGGLIFDAHGNLYGTTETGGTAGCKCGTVFELTPSNGTWTHTILYSFSGGATDGSPLNLTMDSNGNLFGTTAFGQETGNCRFEGDGCGTVFELTPGANGQWTETILYDFAPQGVGVYPSTLVIDSHQNLYGTGYYGGGTSQICYQGCGFVFEVSPDGNGQWTEIDLYDFQGGSDGYEPAFDFALAWSGGNLYGTTIQGGATNLSGTIFSLTPQGSSWQLQTIYTFPFVDGNAASTGLVADGSGNLFGTGAGGAYDEGSVFEMSPASGGGWTESLIYSFNGTYAGQSVIPSALIADPYGNFYGTTQYGGSDNYGSVFELSPSSSKGWTAKTLYSFTGAAADGARPEAGVVLDASGNLFGTTYIGGSKNGGSRNSGGTIFELIRESNGQWKKKVRYNFVGAPFDGELPASSMIMDQAGNFYGTTTTGGSSTNCAGGCGTVFEFSPSPSGWKETILYSFQGSPNDGSDPATSLIFDDAGNLYGTTLEGGVVHCYSNNKPSCGVVFELSPTGNGTWKEAILHEFTNSTSDGGNPTSSLILDAAGNLYGTTGVGGTYGHGTIFKLAPSAGSWTYSVAYNFENVPDGSYPSGNLWLDSSGNLYGATAAGGPALNIYTNGYGTIYEFTP
jgi:uncharacterized repeat protein (TIGR03803 family)